MAELVERVYPESNIRTEITYVYALDALKDGDVVLPQLTPGDHPKVRRTVSEDVVGSITLKLTETEAAVVRALLARTNERGDHDLGNAAFDVYCILEDAELQTDYIKVVASDDSSPTLTFKYGKDDRVFA